MLKITRNNALAMSAVALIFGAIGPWISVLGLISGGPANSLEVGLVVFGGIGLVILSALTSRFMRPVSIIVGALILLEAGHVWYEVSNVGDSEWVSIGWGLYLSILAALFLIASTFLTKQTPMQKYGISKVMVADMPDTDETYVDGKFNPYGRCDTCGAPCDVNGCTKDAFHLVALDV